MVEFKTENIISQRIEYRWECPECHTEQKASTPPNEYNEYCWRCRQAIQARQKEEYFGPNGIMKELSECTITNITGWELHEISKMIFIHPNGTKYVLEAETYDDSDEAWISVAKYEIS